MGPPAGRTRREPNPERDGQGTLQALPPPPSAGEHSGARFIYSGKKLLSNRNLNLFQGRACKADGNLWFTQVLANRIGKIAPAGAIASYILGEKQLEPFKIVAGPDGNPWFTARGLHDRIGRITTSGKAPNFSPRTTAGPAV